MGQGGTNNSKNSEAKLKVMIFTHNYESDENPNNE